MADYHVGCGAFYIYAGTLDKSGKLWKNKSNVTDEATNAVAQYLLEHGKCMYFYHKGRKYVLDVTEVNDAMEDDLK